jgi:chromosome partitioning protein
MAQLDQSGFTLVVIDTAGRETAGSAAAMRAAQLSLIPVRASMLDIRAARLTIAALARLDRPFAFVLNGCPPGRSARVSDAGRALTMMGEAAPSIVYRLDHVDAMGSGRGVTELPGKAGEEIRVLWSWLKARRELQ